MDECKDRDILTVTTTVASAAEARELAKLLLARRLAACVQVEEGLTSFYRWQGRDCADAEVRLTIKTLPQCAGALQGAFAESHPYEVPQFVAWTAQASEAYAAWVRGEVQVPAPKGELDAP